MSSHGPVSYETVPGHGSEDKESEEACDDAIDAESAPKSSQRLQMSLNTRQSDGGRVRNVSHRWRRGWRGDLSSATRTESSSRFYFISTSLTEHVLPPGGFIASLWQSHCCLLRKRPAASSVRDYDNRRALCLFSRENSIPFAEIEFRLPGMAAPARLYRLANLFSSGKSLGAGTRTFSRSWLDRDATTAY